jgi:hypothetical protein
VRAAALRALALFEKEWRSGEKLAPFALETGCMMCFFAFLAVFAFWALRQKICNTIIASKMGDENVDTQLEAEMFDQFLNLTPLIGKSIAFLRAH